MNGRINSELGFIVLLDGCSQPSTTVSLRGAKRRGNLLRIGMLTEMLKKKGSFPTQHPFYANKNKKVVPGDCHGPNGPRNDSGCRYLVAPI